MSQLQQLYQLQQIDTEMNAKKQRLGAVLKALKGNPALLAAQKRVETAVAIVRELETRRQDQNLELQGLNQKAKNSENRLYSGKVKNPKELSDLQSEIASLGRRREQLEEEVLETMLALEEAQAEQAEATELRDALQAEWADESATMEQEKKELALRLHTLTQKRKQQTASIPDRTLTTYENLAQRNNGVAVARLRVNQCQACQLTVSAHKVKQAREGNLVTCGGCGRILYPAG